MKKLLAIAVLVVGLGGCTTACQDSTVLWACKDECHRIENPKKCNCNHKENCCEALKGKVVTSLKE